MNQPVSLRHEIVQQLLLLVEVIGIRIYTKSNAKDASVMAIVV
jgi:hypothetical protein